MKRILYTLALLCLGLCLAGCSGGTTETGTDTEAASGTASAAQTETADTTETAEEDTAVTEQETEPRRELTAEEHRAEIERKTDGGKVVIGGYTTPADMNATATAFENLLKAGVNTMVTGNEFYGQVMISNTLLTADRLGMDIAIQAFGQIYNRNELVAKLRLSAGHSCVKYIYLCDEPLPEQFSDLSRKTAEIRNAYPNEKWKIGSNMFPAAVLDNVGGWYTCSRNYVDKSKSDFLCFDAYPWRVGSTGMDEYLAHVVMEKAVCDEYGTEMLTFLQTAGWDSAVLPSEGQLRFQTNVTLALGADGMFCFTCCDSNDDRRTMILPDGTPDEFYYVCSAVFNDVHAMKGVFLPYSTEKMMVLGEPAYTAAMSAKNDSIVTEERAYGSIADITGERVMVGCMKNADGREGYYIVNSDWEMSKTVTVTFDAAHPYQLWTGKGLEKMGTETALTVELVPGGACFIALDLSLDSYDYAEPGQSGEEATAVPTASEGELIFDLGFDSEGKLTNKAESGVRVKDFCTASYAETDGVPAVSGYDIYTTDITDGAKYGVTVEMYVYLDEKADRKWVTLFYDVFSNNNLHRLFEKSGISYTGAIYQGSYSDADNIIDDTEKTKSLLPTGEWLHIVSVVSEQGQYLYVNGRQVMEAHNPHNLPNGNCFIFVDDNSVCHLNTARVYAYAATAEQVAEMYSRIK